MPRPLIGITSHLEPARWGSWVREAALVATPFLREVDRAGGLPVVLAPVHPRRVDDLVARFDGFVFTTGAPVGASEEDEADPRRDRFETELVRAAVEARRPFLAVERGLQVLNVAAGGSLLPARGPALRLVDTDVTVNVSSGLGKVLGDHARVRRADSPGVNRIGAGLVPVAWDGAQAVEALEVADHPFGIGVRWRPEEADDRRLFRALVEQAGA
ncbi:gamma-glutamyl-gamma-aminobutyrate hydrolase family protein [Thermobifida halotolerans]|uniref:Gamma-glutamyl-gamma-aminobutyrate hydrolase family protein n=1 Tax=Thermobifida halotolerans TaxID=483545 RepID=A0A399G5X0_9ACTN|nr:gamma-glutamyl-gamma-aminobutyrate hydrolase family protein [Thermobifida halotolerans]UOE20523.1 gamma-glutamyl-gamma-aminobutyrate hydrolase family protein [Thermobifida halotolerans]